MQPQISILVPCFNVAPYLDQCLASILGQSFTDYELVCVDDCSTDSTLEILHSFLDAFDGRMKILAHTTNRGLGSARNTAIAAARCEWIASVDSDDWIDSDMMASLYHHAVNTGADIVNTGYKEVTSSGTVLAEYGYAARIDTISPEVNLFNLCWPAFWNKLWRRRLFDDHNILFPDTLHDDLATTPRVLAYSSTVAFIEGCPYNYRQREGSETYSVSFRHISDYIRVFQILEDHFSRQLMVDGRMRFYFSKMVEENVCYHTRNARGLDVERTYEDVAHLAALGYLTHIERAYGLPDRPPGRLRPFLQECYPSRSST